MPSSRNSRNPRFGIVAGRFNSEITEKLVASAVETFQAHKIPKSRIDLIWVPGSFELPVTALRMARSKKYKGIVALACILEGKTQNFKFLSQATFDGLMLASVLTGVPVCSGVITAKNWKQAVARSKGKQLNRGREAALAALEMNQILNGSKKQ